MQSLAWLKHMGEIRKNIKSASNTRQQDAVYNSSNQRIQRVLVEQNTTPRVTSLTWAKRANSDLISFTNLCWLNLLEIQWYSKVFSIIFYDFQKYKIWTPLCSCLLQRTCNIPCNCDSFLTQWITIYNNLFIKLQTFSNI